MGSIKIINVLRDDTLTEILEVFRQAPAGEVIFVLPKNGKVFRKEEHFATFASEASATGKTISIMVANPQLAAMARAYKFNVMSSGPVRGRPAEGAATAASGRPASNGAGKGAKEKPAAALASSPPPTDDVALDKDVVIPSDETMGIENPDVAENEEPLEGFHVEEEDGPVDVDADGDGAVDRPSEEDVQYGEADLVAAADGVKKSRRKVSAQTADIPVPVRAASPAPAPEPAKDNGSMDYIDAVWRQRAAAQGAEITPPQPRPKKSWFSMFHLRERSATPVQPSAPMATPAMSGRYVSRKVAAGILGASAVVLGIVVWATTGSAKVVLTPVSHELDIQLTVQASDVFSSVDSSFSKIPGQAFEATASATAVEEATGSRDVASKARGKITVYNEYSSTPQTLVATTRFGAPNGLIFRTLQTVNVPGSTVVQGRTVPGSVTVDVIADKPGEAYNLPPGKWVVVAFQEKGDTERAEKIYGVSTEAMTGGASGPSKVVTQTDYDKALARAREEAEAKLRQAFDAQAAGMKVLDEASIVWGPVKASAQPDDAAQSVSVTVTATLKTVAFRPSDLDTLIAEFVLAKERLIVVADQLTMSFSDVSYKEDVGTLSFSVSVQGPGYVPLDTDAIIADIKGKGAAQIRDYFAAKEGVESATVTLSPFWVRKVPTKDSRITVEIRYVRPSPTP